MLRSFGSKQFVLGDSTGTTGRKRFEPFATLCLPVLIILIVQTPFAFARAMRTQNKAEQQDQPVRLKAELVEIRAVVADKKGTLITTLNKDDFQLIESGSPQVVSFFSAENLKSEPTAATVANPDSRALPSRSTSSGQSPRRTVVFFADTIHLSNLSLIRLKQEILKFIDEKLGADDLAAVVSANGGLGLFSQFTNDKQVLRNAVSRLAVSPAAQAGTLYTPYLAAGVENETPFALRVAMNIVKAEERLPDDPHLEGLVIARARARARQILSESTYLRRVTLITLKTVAERLSEMPGQRLIMMLSDGFTLLDSSGTADSDDLQAAISRAARFGVVVYTIAAKGLAGSSLYDVSTGRFDPDPQVFNKIPSFISAGDRELENGMTRLAAGTGGESFLTTNDINSALTKAVDNNSFYYSLAYYPASVDDKKAFRAIKVKIKGHPDYTVRTQSGYFSSDLAKDKSSEPSDPQKALLKALGAPLALNGINVEASADFIYLPADNAQLSLNVFIDNSKLGYKQQGESFVTELTLLTGVLDSGGNTINVSQDAIQIRLSREQLEQSRNSVYRYTKRMALKPGLYQLRLGVRDLQSDRMGTTSVWAEIPDLKSKKLILSSISTARFEPGDIKAEQGRGETAAQPNVRNGVNIFRRGELIAYSGKAYKASLSLESASGLMIQEQILQGENVVQQRDWMPMTSVALNKERDGLGFKGKIESADLSPGFYELRILVKDSQSAAVITKATAFEIVR